MSKYKILATIIVEGENIKTEDRALDELSYMKECYNEMMNSDNDTDITIKVQFINEMIYGDY